QRHRVVPGSRQSRRPSPSRLNDNEHRKMAMPGKIASRGACETYDCASESITPQDGVGGCTPRPRNESTASPMIAAGIVTVACTIRRSEEHTSELQSRGHLVCRLLLEKKKKSRTSTY